MTPSQALSQMSSETAQQIWNEYAEASFNADYESDRSGLEAVIAKYGPNAIMIAMVAKVSEAAAYAASSEGDRTMTSIDERGYWDRNEAELKAEMAEATRQAQTPESQIRRLEVQYSATPDTNTERRNQLLDEIEALRNHTEQSAQDRFSAKWTLEATQAARTEWNRRIGSGQKPNQIARETGLNINDIAKAKKLHNL